MANLSYWCIGQHQRMSIRIFASNGNARQYPAVDIDVDDAVVKEEQQRPYSWLSLFIPYLVSQSMLLVYYLCQNVIYDGLKRQPWLLSSILLKVYIFVLATVYIIQWETMWSVWDEFAPTEWYFDFTLSVCSLLALIVTVGHSSDLVCSPFIVTYDSLESCVHLGSPLLTREVSHC